MFILVHLLAGVLVGIALTLIVRDRRVIVMAAIGSVLPDVIDKPAGTIFLANSIGYGRIYDHALIFTGVLLIVGLLLSLRYRSAGPLMLALVAGILSHQLLDFMWNEPVNWFWPALGPFQGPVFSNFISHAFFSEVLNPSEWIAGTVALFLLVRTGTIPRPGLFPYSGHAAAAAIIFGTVAIVSGLFSDRSPLTLLSSFQDTMITSLVIILGAVILLLKWPETVLNDGGAMSGSEN